MSKGSWTKLAEENKGTRQNSQNSFKAHRVEEKNSAQESVEALNQNAQQSQTNEKFQCAKCKKSNIPQDKHPLFWNIISSESFICSGITIE